MNDVRATRQRRFCRALLLLLLALVCSAAGAAPIPLTKPVDLRGKRVLVVPVLGHEAGAFSVGRMFFGGRERELGDAGALDIDGVAAREAEARLDGLGVNAEVWRVEYKDSEIYFDEDTFYVGGSPRRPRIEALARRLLETERPDAVLMLARGQIYMGDYNPPALGYGVILTPKLGSAYVSMWQLLYTAEYEKPLAFRAGSGRLLIEGVASEKDLSYPPPETWAKAHPLLEDLAGRLARSLAAEAFDRALRPPPAATSRWKSRYPREEGLDKQF